MRSIARTGLLALPFAMLMFAAAAVADPGDDHGHDDIPVSPPSQPNFGSGIDGMKLLDVADKDGTINSDIAFYGKRAYVGNYDGFRIFDIRKPTQMDLLSDTRCRANQGDLSVFKAKDGRMIMLQSIDRPVTAPDCSGVDTATIDEDQLGVTATRSRLLRGPAHVRRHQRAQPEVPADVPQPLRVAHPHAGANQEPRVRVHPVLSARRPHHPAGRSPAVRPAGPDLRAPHSKISIVSIPLADPEGGTVRTKALSSDTESYDPDGPYQPTGGPTGGPIGTAPAFQSCHDHQAFMPRKIMVAACAGDAQYWDISNPGNPTSGNGEAHTHISREVRVDDPTTPGTSASSRSSSWPTGP